MSRKADKVRHANKQVNAIIQSFISRYELALKQVKEGTRVEINPKDLEEDSKALRLAFCGVLREVGSLQEAIEDLID